jgi:hypothetical protein
MTTMDIIVTGNPVDGFKFFGPFSDREAAVQDWNDLSEGDWWVATVERPDPDAGTYLPGLPLLTARDLFLALAEAFTRGIDPNTAVVIANDGWYNEISADFEDPTKPDSDFNCFTLYPTREIDARFTPMHYPKEDQ